MNWKKYLSIVLVFVLGISAGALGGRVFDGSSTTGYQYEYLAKRIQIENPNTVKINFTTLRNELNEYIYNLKSNGSNVSVYYEYLPSGVSININEKNESVAASLMKLPIVMNLYKAAELGKVKLDDKVTLRQEWLNSDYGDLYKKGAGYELTIREAAALTLRNSDNTALMAIWDSVSKANLDKSDQALYYLDVDYNVLKDESVLIGARSYSSILKCLYLSCFNSKDHSNEILHELSGSSFNDRLTKYLPINIKVAHKIGTYSEKYQSDCGIFYIPRENYLLCIMVQGTDPESSSIIADISQKVYLFTKGALGTE